MDSHGSPARLSWDPELTASSSCRLQIQTSPEASTQPSPLAFPFPFTILVSASQRLPTVSGRCLMAARPSSLVSSGKAWGGSRKGVGRCRGQTDPSPPAALAAMGPGLLFPLLLLEALGAPGSELDAGGRHVCKASSPSAELQCCPGWRRKDRECTIPICEGLDACREDEVCVKPGLCRCKPGFFGAQCNSRCPGQYWGPDCREVCACHPHGQCEPATGVCHCQPDRWGDRCEFPCACGPHGRCNPETGACRCEPGWWSPTCRRPCQCNPAAARCDQATGSCLCEPGWWGRRCSFRCACHGSPCAQESGRCACRPGWWGPECRQPCECVRGRCSAVSGQCSCPPGFQGVRCELPCPAGQYGLRCRDSCGHCKQNKPCSADTGSCEACKPGWNGTQCHQPCPPGTFGENCSQQCPHCRLGEACQPDTGHCQRCEPGWRGPRCEDPCLIGTFGEGCGSTCPTCVQGACDAVTGECVCNAGYWGPSCNTSCPSGFHGNNCSVPCECPEGNCDPVSGACQLGSHSQDAALVAGILVPLLLLLLAIACCACCCWAARLDPKDRPVRDGTAMSRMKLRVWGALTSSLGSALPCGPLSSHKLPWVTASSSRPPLAGLQTTPSLRIPSLEKRMRVLPIACHPKKGWSLRSQRNPQRPAWLEVPSLPLRMPPRRLPSRALPASLGPSGHQSPLLKAPSSHHRVAEAPGSCPALSESPRGSPGGPSQVLKARRLRSPQALKWKQMGPLLVLPAPGIQLLVAAGSHLVAGQWLSVWKPSRAVSRKAQALSPRSTCWQGHPGDLRAPSGLSSAVLVASRKARQNPRSRVPFLSLHVGH
ncbi:scavenger receptor class F member 1 isoform X2 [Bos indicus]|uniref:Scavenger receptor class F member 1 isoform X2 n=1 Tax=Bos indicus TaxID=9915 RepID=A0A6P5DGM5_BOSIN